MGQDKHFIDQELFSFTDGACHEPTLSLDHVRNLMDLPGKKTAAYGYFGRAGVGKTTFCERAVRLINGYQKKRAILISSTDLRDAATLCEFLHTEHSRPLCAILKVHPARTLPRTGEHGGQCCVLALVLVIDGLDEIESILKDNFDLDAFVESCCGTQQILT